MSASDGILRWAGPVLTLAAIASLPPLARAQWEPDPEPPPPQAPPDSPPQTQPGYPPQSQPGYPPQAQPGYPPQAQPGYPPRAQAGYPPQSPYPGSPPPQVGYHPGYGVAASTRYGTRARRELWLSGLGAFALAYCIPVLIVATTSDTDDDVWFAPVAGPFLWLGDNADRLDGEAITWIVIDAVMQLVGLVGFVVGLAATERYEIGDGGVARRVPTSFTASVGPGSLRARWTL